MKSIKVKMSQQKIGELKVIITLNSSQKAKMILDRWSSRIKLRIKSINNKNLNKKQLNSQSNLRSLSQVKNKVKTHKLNKTNLIFNLTHLYRKNNHNQLHKGKALNLIQRNSSLLVDKYIQQIQITAHQPKPKIQHRNLYQSPNIKTHHNTHNHISIQLLRSLSQDRSRRGNNIE